MLSQCRGAGLGLRPAHLHEVCSEQVDTPWFEVHICNYLGGGLNRALLHQVAERYALSFHGVNLNLGGVEPLDKDYLQRLKDTVDEFQPALLSEHTCFTMHGGQYFHDLMPVPYTREAASHLASRIQQVQDTLQRHILIENISRYYAYPKGELELYRDRASAPVFRCRPAAVPGQIDNDLAREPAGTD